ncbi:glycosyl hydrolase [Microbacterium sp.]|uniref:glycosyl hydrolase n=1 Tax=Microbacterium sp. TaxID=51671 RepID=UPI0028963CAE|nr:glycosyl hydrolase [Microbacterium sp.]
MTVRSGRLAALAAVATVVVVTLAACTDAATAPRATPAPAASAAIAQLPVEHLSAATPLRVADGLTPPTSRWYSSLAFSADLLPIYPYPLAVAPRDDGLTVQVPPVSATATTITAGFTGGLSLGFGATGIQIVRADPVSVTVAYASADGEAARVTLAEGSPVVALTASRDLDITLSAPPVPLSDGAWTATSDGVTYLLRGDARVDGSTVTVSAGASLQIAGLPTGADPAAWAAAIGDPVTGVETTHTARGDTATTRLDYTGTDRTVVVPFAGRDAAASCDLGTFATAYGPAPACAATRLEWSVPALTAASDYDFADLDDATRDTLARQATADLQATTALPADTYYGGKALARLASLAALGRALGDDTLTDAAAARLADELAPWLETGGCATRASRCFVFDDVLHLVVGRESGFGSEDGNDHHFHYGYFLFAAGVLGSLRPDLVDTLRPVMDALAADVAAGSDGGGIAPLRVFDPYRGHSWAAGLSPFADGNDQESSSEAVAAWNGLALWAQASGDATLADEATWLLSSEADAALSLWLEPGDLPEAFAHSIVSLTWSAKRDYATWFSADPSAILGIQTMPLGPVSLQYLGRDPARVARNVADAGDAAFTGPLGDYVQGYAALASRAGAEAAATAFAERTEFDDGWSKALALAWVAAVELRR